MGKYSASSLIFVIALLRSYHVYSLIQPMTMKSVDIAVFGCGVLGTSFCRQVLKSPEFAERRVTAITKTTDRHDEIYSEVLGGLAPCLNEDGRLSLITTDEAFSEAIPFRDVVFCAPPSGFEDYPSAVKDAMNRLWDKDSGGVFVFTSSGAVYDGKNNGETVNESSPTPFADDPDSSPRIIRLVNAETLCRNNDGTILRLAGLYTLERGAHNFWLNKKNTQIRKRGDGIVNLLHYDDAARACMSTILAGEEKVRGETFLISDGVPATRAEICQSALKSKLFSGRSMPMFVPDEDDDDIGKVFDGSRSNEILNWKPKYGSFDEFMRSHA